MPDRIVQQPLLPEYPARDWTDVQCTKCRQWQPPDSFPKCARRKTGRQSQCKSCRAAYRDANREAINNRQAAYLAENREAVNARKAKYRAKHRETIAAYRANNAEAIKAYKAAYHAEHREAVKASQAAYRRTPAGRERMRRINHSRRAAGQLPQHWETEQLERQESRCYYCQQMITFEAAPRASNRATIEHVQPVSRGGKTTPGNCVLACWPCNLRKSDRPWRLV